MAEPIGVNVVPVTENAHRVAVEIDLSEIAGRLEREALRVINDLTQQGLSGDDLADAVTRELLRLSDVPVERAARGAASESFSLGRNLAAQEMEAAIRRVVRSEVLDENTCTEQDHGDGVSRCLELDGTEYEVNSPEYFEYMPPNKCDGRVRCRGFYIYLS